MNPFFQRDTGPSLRSKGIDFPEPCRVLEVCKPRDRQTRIAILKAAAT